MASPFIDDRNLFFQQLSILLAGGDMCIDVPSDYHSQVKFIKNEMLRDDRSGIVATIIEFMVATATVDFTCHTGNQSLNKILDEWKEDINSEFIQQVPSGVRALANQYFRERWTNSITALNISWKEDSKTGLILPDKMWFVDGSQLYAEGEGRTLGGYTYWIGKPENEDSKELPLANTTVLIRKSNSFWYDKYPVPYLIKRGTAYHWKVKKTLVEKQFDVLKSMLPYLLLARKGTENLFLGGQDVSQPELDELLGKLQQLTSDAKTKMGPKGLVGAFPFDTQIEHLLPDLQKIFNEQIIAPTDRNLLASLGLIEIIEGISTSRRDAILNPKPLVEEIKSGVRDFQDILVDVLKMIKQKNIDEHPKYFTNAKMKVTASTIKAFVTNDMRVMIRSWYDRGLVSKPQALDATTDLDFQVQVDDRIEEENNNIDDIMLPPPIMWSPELDGVGDEPENPEEIVENPETKTSQPDIKADISDLVCPECDGIIDLEANAHLKNKKVIECPNCHAVNDYSEQYSRMHKDEKKKKKRKPYKYTWASVEDEIDATIEEMEYFQAPYNKNEALPESVKVLPQGAQTIWRKTFNSVYEQNSDMPKEEREQMAIRVAWSQVKKSYKKVADKWVKK